MSKDLTSNAMIAKAQGLFAKRLQAAQYRELIGKKTIGDIAGYLRKETYFASVLEGINEQGIHRGQLEMLIRQNPYDKMKRLLRYIDADKHEFFYLTMYNYEISLLLVKIRSFNSEDREDFMSTTYLTIDEGNASFDYSALYHVRNYEALIQLLEGTLYGPVIARFAPNENNEVNYTALEQELNAAVMEHVMKIIVSHYRGKERQAITEAIETHLELINVSRLYRLKKYFHPTEQEIREWIVTKSVWIPSRTWEQWITSSDADQIYDMLRDTPYKVYMKEEPFLYIEHHLQQISYRMAQKQLRTSSIPEVVFYQYMNFLNIEVENLIHVIEGVRYHHDPSRIEARIVQ